MEKAKKFCPNCGAELKSDADFCPNCGFKLSKKTDKQSQVPKTEKKFKWKYFINGGQEKKSVDPCFVIDGLTQQHLLLGPCFQLFSTEPLI